MADDPIILAAKQDFEFGYSILGLRGPSNHGECPFCGDKTCLRAGPMRDDPSIFGWQCMKGCGKGTVIDALMLMEKKDFKTVAQDLRKKYGSGGQYHVKRVAPQPRQSRPEQERIEPVLDMDRAIEFRDKAHKHLLNNLHLVKTFRRGLTEEVIIRHKVGFIENTPLFFPGSRNGWNIPASWTLPVDAPWMKMPNPMTPIVKGIKLHMEIRPPNWPSKSLWAPFGTKPDYDPEKDIKPQHSFYGLWPHPSLIEPPRVAINTDIASWIKRIPQGSKIEQQFEDEKKYQTEFMAIDQKIMDTDLSPSDRWEAITRAFNVLRKDIIKAVREAESKSIKEEVDDDVPNWLDFIFLCPGELKALAVESCGYMATSVTGGEGWMPPQRVMEPLEGAKVIICRDDDPIRLDTSGKSRCAGRMWASRMDAALRRVNVSCILHMSLGQRMKELEL